MREDDEYIRLHKPFLRRIIILVAVLTVVPVVLWTITAFMRTYVARPNVPTFRSLAEAAFAKPPQNAAANPQTIQPPAAAAAAEQAKPATPVPAIVEARATVTDAGSPAPIDTKGPVPGAQPRDSDVSAPASEPKVVTPALAALTLATPPAAGPTSAPAATQPAQLAAVERIAAPGASERAAPAPDQVPDTGPALTAQQQQPPASSEPVAEPLPPAAPIAGPIPLPPHRPRVFTVAQTGVPIPRPRPAAAPEPSSTINDAPFARDRDYPILGH